ncbi:hypothetical protein, partial [Pseudomonas aeruginosa]|uniref:hypothetical protein n=1 Tax=Pseudomonas aeruginosa TaxID=287 RepID=UPI0021199BCC
VASPSIIATPHRQRFMRLLHKKKGTEGIKPYSPLPRRILHWRRDAGVVGYDLIPSVPFFCMNLVDRFLSGLIPRLPAEDAPQWA